MIGAIARSDLNRLIDTQQAIHSQYESAYQCFWSVDKILGKMKQFHPSLNISMSSLTKNRQLLERLEHTLTDPFFKRMQKVIRRNEGISQSSMDRFELMKALEFKAIQSVFDRCSKNLEKVEKALEIKGI